MTWKKNNFLGIFLFVASTRLYNCVYHIMCYVCTCIHICTWHMWEVRWSVSLILCYTPLLPNSYLISTQDLVQKSFFFSPLVLWWAHGVIKVHVVTVGKVVALQCKPPSLPSVPVSSLVFINYKTTVKSLIGDPPKSDYLSTNLRDTLLGTTHYKGQNNVHSIFKRFYHSPLLLIVLHEICVPWYHCMLHACTPSLPNIIIVFISKINSQNNYGGNL